MFIKTIALYSRPGRKRSQERGCALVRLECLALRMVEAAASAKGSAVSSDTYTALGPSASTASCSEPGSRPGAGPEGGTAASVRLRVDSPSTW